MVGIYKLQAAFLMLVAMAVACGDKDEDTDTTEQPQCAQGEQRANGQCVSILSGSQPQPHGQPPDFEGADGNDSETGDGEDEQLQPPTQPTISLAAFVSNRRVAIHTEVDQRTVHFTASAGSSVECSRDDGETFSECDSSSTIIWNPEDIAVNHIIRATATNAAGSSSWEESFIPSQFAGIEVVTCDVTIDTGGDFDDFVNAVDPDTGDRVVCFGQDVAFTKDGNDINTTISIGANGLTLIAPFGHNFSMTSDVTTIFDTNGADSFRIVGATLVNTTGYRVVHINSSEGAELIDVSIDCSGNNSGSCVELDLSGVETSIALEDVSIVRDNPGNGSALEVNSSAVRVINGELAGGYHALTVYYSTEAFMQNVYLTTDQAAASTARGIINIRRDSSVHLYQSEVFSNGDHHAVVNYFNETVGSKLITDETTYKRSAVAAAAPFAAIYLEGGQFAPRVNSGLDGNLFCQEETSVTGPLAEVLDQNGAANIGTMAIADQANNGAIVACP